MVNFNLTFTCERFPSPTESYPTMTIMTATLTMMVVAEVEGEKKSRLLMRKKQELVEQKCFVCGLFTNDLHYEVCKIIEILNTVFCFSCFTQT